MSKKEIITPDNGDKIKKAVSSYLEHASLYYNPYGYWDDYYGYDDDWCDYWAHTLKKEKKEKKRDKDELPFWDDERENKEEREIFFWQRLYSKAIEVGQYICKIFRLRYDFEKCVDKRDEGYRLNYIFGDDERTR